MFLKVLLSFCQPFLHGWSWKTQHLLDVVQLSRSWELEVSRGWWIPASSCSMEKDDLMCLGCFWSCCARAAGLCVHLASEAPGMRHPCCCVHTSTWQPRDLGLAHSHWPAHVHWPFLRSFLTPCSLKSRQILCREGRRRKWSIKVNLSCICWAVQSLLWPWAMQAVGCFSEISRLGLRLSGSPHWGWGPSHPWELNQAPGLWDKGG